MTLVPALRPAHRFGFDWEPVLIAITFNPAAQEPVHHRPKHVTHRCHQQEQPDRVSLGEEQCNQHGLGCCGQQRGGDECTDKQSAVGTEFRH